MPHGIILGNIDCIVANFPEAADSARELKTVLEAAHDRIHAAEFDATINAAEIQAKFDEIAPLASDMCGNGGFTAAEVCETLDNWTTGLRGLLP